MNPLNPPGPAIDQTSLCNGKARRGGGGRAWGGLIYFCGGIRGQILCFRVMGVITSDGKHFLNTDPLCIATAQVCVCVEGGGEGGKNWASSFLVILGFLVERYNLNQQMQGSW